MPREQTKMTNNKSVKKDKKVVKIENKDGTIKSRSVEVVELFEDLKVSNDKNIGPSQNEGVGLVYVEGEKIPVRVRMMSNGDIKITTDSIKGDKALSAALEEGSELIIEKARLNDTWFRLI